MMRILNMRLLWVLAAIVAAASIHAAGIRLEWQASPSGEAVKGYIVYQATTADGPYTPVAHVPSTNAVLDVTPGRYFYYVRATNFWSESEPSNTAVTPLPATKIEGTKVIFVREPVTVTNLVTITNSASESQGPPPLPLVVNGQFNGLAGWTTSGNLDNGAGDVLRFNAGQREPNGVVIQAVQTTPGQAYRLEFQAGIVAYLTRDSATDTYRRWPQEIGVEVRGLQMLTNRSITLTPPATNATTWSSHSIQFRAESGLTAITFRDASTATDSTDCFIDNVRITSP